MDSPTPDRAFMAQLKTMDKALGIKFNGEHFVITYQARAGLCVNIWKVVAGDGGFRQPDRRDLEILQQSNIEKESPEEKQQRVERYMETVRAKDRKNAKEMLRDRTKDDKIQLFNAFGKIAGGKHNSAFRRVPIIGPQG
jgi:hypothetical protein